MTNATDDRASEADAATTDGEAVADLAAGDVESLSFEDAYGALNEIVAKLESGGLTLDDALALHAHGVGLANRCASLLEEAELRIREIDADGRDARAVDVS